MALLLVDLDGTLIDSVEGISNCVRHALGAMGTPVPDDATLRSWIGPPLRNSFARIFDDPRQVEQAISLYRERFDELGWREHQVYAGVGEALGALRDAGHRLAVCTAKIERHAERIVAHLPFAHLFERITGATPDGRIGEKPQLIALALERLGAVPEGAWMIGDRHHDVEGARHHGMRSAGVLWGFGSEQELRHAGADVLVGTPAELADLPC
ncbi:MAG TPA: HAD hydrolase-like protein [Pseudomonadota bacterium]|nr:HAD hydrolase-like protein [Pseudomonadota bacterium]